MAASSSLSPILSLGPACRLVEGDDGRLAIEGRGLRLELLSAGAGLGAALRRLAGDGASEEDLAAAVGDTDGPGALLELHALLAELRDARSLCRTLTCGGEPLVTCVPTANRPTAPDSATADRPFVLSRFTYLRRDGARLVAESPLAHAYWILHGTRGAALFAALGTPVAAPDLADRVAGLEPAEAEAVLQLLAEEGLLSPVDAAGEAREDGDGELLSWEFHDLLFHARSRAGRHANPYGGTFPFLGTLDPPPALDPHAGDETAAELVDLPRPDIERLKLEDPPFTRVVEERRSRRRRGERPIDRDELGELLYRSSRLRRVVVKDTHEVSERVYPGGGAVYELEIYLATDGCSGLADGLYRYDPAGHRLARRAGETPEWRALLDAAGRTARSEAPEVLIVLAARFRRVTWKYRSMAYAGILKDVGVLYQNLYLVATAMGLAGCALGGGDSDLFARASGASYLTEGSVGEFILSRGDG
jgi:oxazoline/thiazoline dehydrogenase